MAKVSLLIIAGINILIVAAGAILAKGVLQSKPEPVFLSIAAATVGIVTFLGTLQLLTDGGEIKEAHLRKAITVAVVTLYLIIVGEASFFMQPHQFSGLSEAMVKSFNWVVGAVVGFYFASSAYLKARDRAD